MRSIVHIGYYKCGSTALQASLVAGARDLLQVGCLVPMSGRVANGSHGELAFSLLQEHEQRIPEWYLRSIPGEPPSFESVAGDFADEVAREQPETILVSSEELVRLGSIESSEQAVERFAGCLPDGEAQILVYIRRPDHYIVAWYGQLIRIGASVPPLKRGIRRWVKTIHVDFKRALQPWVDHFGPDRIVLRDYNALVGGDVLADFADATGFELPAPRSGGRVNQSVPPALLESLRRQNMVESGNKFRNLRVDALGRLADSPIWDRLSKARVDLLGVKGRTLLLEQFQESNAWLGSLAGRDLFYPDLETDVMEASGGMTDVQAHARFGDALQTAMIAELFDRS